MINFSDVSILDITFNSFLKGKMALIYLALARKGNTPIVSYNEIALATGYSKKTVIETIKALESSGLIIKLLWNSLRGESDKNCYILFSPNDPFNRDEIDTDKAEYITRALEQLRSYRDGQPVIEPWLAEVVKITPPGVEITPDDIETKSPDNDSDGSDDENQGRKINLLGGGSVNITLHGDEDTTFLRDNNVDDESFCKRSKCQQRNRGVKSGTPDGKVNVDVSPPLDKKGIIRLSYKKRTTPWVRFLAPDEKVNQNEIIINLKDFFGVDLCMAVANATVDRIYLAIDAVLQYAKRTAIRNLQGILVKAVICGWTVSKKVFITQKSKKQEIIAAKKNLTDPVKGRDKYRDLYRLVPTTY